jgi:hypothetical protein
MVLGKDIAVSCSNHCVALFSEAIIGVGQSFSNGCTIVLARKFSASNFWKDCITYDVTHFQVNCQHQPTQPRFR